MGVSRNWLTKTAKLSCCMFFVLINAQVGEILAELSLLSEILEMVKLSLLCICTLKSLWRLLLGSGLVLEFLKVSFTPQTTCLRS